MLLQLAQIDVFTAVIEVMSRSSVNGLVVVIARVWVAVCNSVIRGTVLASRQRPNHPYLMQDVPNAGVAFVGVAFGDNVVVSRHPPNQPYLTQDVVGISVVVVELEDLVELDVVVSSRHPEDISCSSQRQPRNITYPTIRGSGRLWFALVLLLTSCCSTK